MRATKRCVKASRISVRVSDFFEDMEYFGVPEHETIAFLTSSSLKHNGTIGAGLTRVI